MLSWVVHERRSYVMLSLYKRMLPCVTHIIFMYYSLVFASINRVHCACVIFVAAAAVAFAQVTHHLDIKSPL